VTNLCRHGAQICGTGSFKVGDHLALVFAPSQLAVAGTIIWHTTARRRRAGIAFEVLAPDVVRAIDELLGDQVDGAVVRI